jgi:hypothetical protein
MVFGELHTFNRTEIPARFFLNKFLLFTNLIFHTSIITLML